MKINELLTESIRLREFVESTELIDMLTQAVENTETNDPVHQQAMQLVDQLLAAVKQPAPAKPAAAPAPVPVQQAPVQQAPTPSPFEKPGVATPVAEARALSGVEKIKLDAIKKLQNDPRLEQLLSDPANARLIISLHEKSIEQGKDIQHRLYLEWNDALEEQANKLASKVYNNASVIHGAIETNIARDNAGSALDLSEAKGKKKEETGEVIKNKIVDILKTMFDRPVKTERDRVAVEAMKQSIKEFMTKCQTGVIDFHRVLANKDPNAKIDDFVQGTDQKIYYIIRNEAFEAKPGVTGGAWGPGEIGLALLSNPVTKGSSGGDLRVQTEAGLIEIELKGMKEAKSGGRFNSDKGIVKASQAAKAFRPVANQLVSELAQIINNGKAVKNIDAETKKLFTYVSNQKTGKTKIKAIETFDYEAITKVWNPQLIIPASTIDPVATKESVRTFLRAMMDIVVLSAGKNYAEPHIRALVKDPAIFEKVAGTKGAFQLNWLALQAGICRILYAVYSGLDDKGVIMYFNTVTSNYYVVKGPEDVQEKILAGLLKTGNAILDFKAGQVPASPQVGIA